MELALEFYEFSERQDLSWAVANLQEKYFNLMNMDMDSLWDYGCWHGLIKALNCQVKVYERLESIINKDRY